MSHCEEPSVRWRSVIARSAACGWRRSNPVQVPDRFVAENGRELLAMAILLRRRRDQGRRPLLHLFRRHVLDMSRDRPGVAERVFDGAGTIAVELVFER